MKQASYQNIIIQTKETNKFSLKYMSDNIFHVTLKEGSIIEASDVEDIVFTSRSWVGFENKYFLLVSEAFVTIEKEARDELDRIEKDRRAQAIAVVVNKNQLAFRLVVNFYYQYYKPYSDYKVFSNEKLAAKWLIKHMSKKAINI